MIKAFAAMSAKTPLQRFEYIESPLGAFDIRVQISHCGVCHSDIHLIENDWGISTYPLVPGHEIVGKVVSTGSSVSHLVNGDRVGIGWQRSSCGVCPQCIKGDDNLCAKQSATCVANHGGYADSIVTDGRFAFKIPDALSSEGAAPLLCGGITVYSPLRVFGVKPHHRVGIVGIGGLGHLGIQFANKFGCEVTALSSSPSKKAEALKMGAAHFFDSSEKSNFKKYSRRFDFILSTVNADLPWADYINLLAPDGKFCFVGVPKKEVSIPVTSLLGDRRTICASPIGSKWMIQEMLDFSARKNISAITELSEMTEVNSALLKVKENKVRFRMVLKALV